MLRFRGCPVQWRRVYFAGLLPVGAIAMIKPKKQPQEKERRHEQQKNQYGFQKIIHGMNLISARCHIATRSIGSSADFPTAGANKRR